MGGKRYSDEGFDFDAIPWKKIGIVLLIVLLVAGIVFGVYYGIKIYNENEKENVVEEQVPENNLPEQIEGYNVLGKILIESIGVNEYILDSYEDKALEKGVGKLSGENLNTEGNFTIVGHNYEDVFRKLEELEVENEFYVENRNSEKTYYKITEILTTEPTDLTNLLPSEGKTEITLITCQAGSTSRLVVKAEKIDAPSTTEKVPEATNEIVENTVTNE